MDKTHATEPLSGDCFEDYVPTSVAATADPPTATADPPTANADPPTANADPPTANKQVPTNEPKTETQTVEEMSVRMTRIEESIGSINRVLETLVCKLERDHKTTNDGVSKMTEHIDFIESVYDRVRHPLNFLLMQVSRIGGTERKCLTSDGTNCPTSKDYKRTLVGGSLVGGSDGKTENPSSIE